MYFQPTIPSGIGILKRRAYLILYRKPMHEERMNEKTGYISIGDYKLFYRFAVSDERRDRPPLIFLHDSWGCVASWGDYPDKVAGLLGLNVMMYDRRGHGCSDAFAATPRSTRYLHESAEELIRAMDALHIGSAVLYGHSDGATIALIAAAGYPDRIRAIVLESPHSFMEEEGVAAVRESRDKARTSRLLRSLELFHGEKTDELFRRWHQAWLDEAFARWSIAPLLKQIQCPVLAFRGECDPFDTVKQLHVLQRDIPSEVVVAIIPQAGHTPRKEHEAAVLHTIGKSVARLSDAYGC